jgi:hypothetical protein
MICKKIVVVFYECFEGIPGRRDGRFLHLVLIG